MSGSGTMLLAVEKYITERRQLGFQMAGIELHRFARFADGLGHQGPITAEIQISWAKLHVRKTTDGTGARRLQTLRPFVQHYRQNEPTSVVVDPSILGRARGRPTPHIYTNKELADLVGAAAMLDGDKGMRGLVHSTLFGLIAATGMRLSEAINLSDVDVDLTRAQLTIRQTKFNKSRRLPLQHSTIDALRLWHQQRERRWPSSNAGSFFVGRRGTALKKRNIEWNFEKLRKSLGWKSRGTLPQPRIHDLRHTFAVRRVQLWHEQGTSLDQAMFWLCTYLGHTKISDTYWYLTGVPELMAIAGNLFDDYVKANCVEDSL